MRPARSLLLTFALAATLPAPGCMDAPEYYYGESLLDVRFVIWSLDTGVHPSKAVLADPSNPFREHPPSADMKWQLLTYGGDSAAFYAWATVLAVQPNGEAQFYTGKTLERLYRNDGLTAVEKPYVKQLALDAYAAVLAYFPDDVTYDTTGTVPYRVAPFAYDSILGLGGTPPPGWVRVTTPSGGTDVIPSAALPEATP